MPVVSTDVGGVPSILRHGVDGLLVADNDDAALAAQVSKLLADPASRSAGSPSRRIARCRRMNGRSSAKGGFTPIASAFGHDR